MLVVTVIGGIATAIDYFVRFVDVVSRFIGWVIDGVANIGRAIFEGIVNGFTSAKDSVFGWASDIVSGVKHALGIRSPSAVFREMGEMSALGFEEGLGTLGLAQQQGTVQVRGSAPGGGSTVHLEQHFHGVAGDMR